MPAIVDLSHTITEGMTTYPGLDGPVIKDVMTRQQSFRAMEGASSFSIKSIDIVANTGTYLDTPHHRFETGYDLSELDLTKVTNVPGVVIQHSGPQLDPHLIADVDVHGKAVLFLTGWSSFFGTESYGASHHPFLSTALVEALVEAGPSVVGIDSVNIDSMSDLARPAHSGLLAAGIPIVEHLTHLDRLPTSGFRFFAVPPAVAEVGTFPVRAFAILDERNPEP
ncbi:MAG: cyclase family protein [Acidimicrobiia bacterium]|nr:cyclase family protein [Acidimicrobiia bacterium]